MLLVWVVVAEGAVRVVAAASPWVNAALESPHEAAGVAPMVPDTTLERRGNPSYPDHDERGWRNRDVPASARVVALGDSHTYGTSVDRESAWPQQLERLLGERVYNMGLPGYGPGHYSRLLDEALAFDPSVVAVGLYMGNDLYDVYRLAWRDRERGLLPDSIHALTGSPGDGVPLQMRNRLFEPAARPDSQSTTAGPRRLLSEHSRLYALLRSVRYAAASRRPRGLLNPDFDRAVASLTDEQRKLASVADEGGWRTILTGAYRRPGLDVDDPRIVASREATLALLRDMDQLARSKGTRLVVLLLPTKESVFGERITDPEEHVGLQHLLASEAEHREVLVRELAAAGIAFLDLLPALQAADSQPYFENANGHPNEVGQGIVAHEVAGWIERDDGGSG
jgi:lysophospholipase L1-like esterase